VRGRQSHGNGDQKYPKMFHCFSLLVCQLVIFLLKL
jgi:hypothetical protein